MGNFLKLPVSQIIPSQDFLKENTVRHIFQCLADGNTEDLPPTPIVRRHPIADVYIAIDGHNLLAVRDYRGEVVDVYVAESETDGLPDDGSASITERNAELLAKYDSALQEADRLTLQGIACFADLSQKYPELFV